MNVADYQQARLERLGDRIADLKKQGICSHGWLKTPPGENQTVCLDCGTIFSSFSAALQAGKDILRG